MASSLTTSLSQPTTLSAHVSKDISLGGIPFVHLQRDGQKPIATVVDWVEHGIERFKRASNKMNAFVDPVNYDALLPGAIRTTKAFIHEGISAWMSIKTLAPQEPRATLVYGEVQLGTLWDENGPSAVRFVESDVDVGVIAITKHPAGVEFRGQWIAPSHFHVSEAGFVAQLDGITEQDCLAFHRTRQIKSALDALRHLALLQAHQISPASMMLVVNTLEADIPAQGEVSYQYHELRRILAHHRHGTIGLDLENYRLGCRQVHDLLNPWRMNECDDARDIPSDLLDAAWDVLGPRGDAHVSSKKDLTAVFDLMRAKEDRLLKTHELACLRSLLGPSRKRSPYLRAMYERALDKLIVIQQG